MSDWISVDDALPRLEMIRWDIFIVADNCGNVTVGYYHRDGGKFLDEPYGMGLHGVTHWMPLPSCPTAGN